MSISLGEIVLEKSVFVRYVRAEEYAPAILSAGEYPRPTMEWVCKIKQLATFGRRNLPLQYSHYRLLSFSQCGTPGMSSPTI